MVVDVVGAVANGAVVELVAATTAEGVSIESGDVVDGAELVDAGVPAGMAHPENAMAMTTTAVIVLSVTVGGQRTPRCPRFETTAFG